MDLLYADNFKYLGWNSEDEYAKLYELFYKNKNNSFTNIIPYAYDLCTYLPEEEGYLLYPKISHYPDKIEVTIFG